MEEMNSELVIRLNDSIQIFKYFAIELDDSIDINNTFYMRCEQISCNYWISLCGSYGKDLYEWLLTALEQHKHTQNTLIIMTRAKIFM
jgi:hypothetical protein